MMEVKTKQKTLDILGIAVKDQYSPNISMTYLWKFGLDIDYRSCKRILKKKYPCCTHFVRFRCTTKGLRYEVFKYLRENYVTSEGAISDNVLHTQQLFNARYQVICFYDNIYFE